MQLREDGLALDQIVLSPVQYLNNAPGAPKNDTTILPKTGGGSQITLVRQPYLQQVRGSSLGSVGNANRVEQRFVTGPILRRTASECYSNR